MMTDWDKIETNRQYIISHYVNLELDDEEVVIDSLINKIMPYLEEYDIDSWKGVEQHEARKAKIEARIRYSDDLWNTAFVRAFFRYYMKRSTSSDIDL